jgi:hypothetical protein
VVPGHPGQKISWDPISTEEKGGCEKYNRRITVQASLDKKQDPISKITIGKRARGMDEGIDTTFLSNAKP